MPDREIRTEFRCEGHEAVQALSDADRWSSEEYVIPSVFDGHVARLSPPPFVRFARFQLAQATNSHREAGVRVSMSRPRFRWSSTSAAQPNMRA